ncbi:MAG: dTDP-4-dehydrorhamnose reductase [Lentimicrobium sp.]|jgi:dTDP-4-dehydrorhamnose reductase|nr:dTDP-4-dehydrorhamnose reductase [Lentimicrobium sp.]
MSTKILVTGSNGQLGNELRLLAATHPEMNFLFTDVDELNITHPDKVQETMRLFKPQWLINCAAYTSVDKAELEPELAFLLNAEAPGILATAAHKAGARMVHISTDYVFDGRNYKPYEEDDALNPLGQYAQSKAKGEQNVLSHCEKAIVIRTAWLYSTFGANFVKTIRRVGKDHGELKVVADQVGSPTWAHDLAEAILLLIQLNAEPGIIHFSNEGACSWYDFACAIVEFSGLDAKVKPTDTAGYPLPSPRPYYSLLNKSKYSQITNQSVPYWRDSLKKCIALLNEQG